MRRSSRKVLMFFSRHAWLTYLRSDFLLSSKDDKPSAFRGRGARATLSPAGRMAQIHSHVVVRRVSAADDFAGDDFLLVLALHQEIDRLSLVERKQQRLGNRIGPIILFQHLNRVSAARVAQNDRVRLQVLRNARYSRSATVAREGAYQSRPRAIRRLREDFPGDSGSATSHVWRRLPA